MNDYPPEVQAVLDAAQALVDSWPSDTTGMRTPQATAFSHVVTAYRKSVAPPEPFEAFLHGVDDYVKDPENGYWYVDLRDAPDGDDDVVYRCTVTPVERVR